MNSRGLRYHFIVTEEDYSTILYEQQRTTVPFHMNSTGLRYHFIVTEEDYSTISYEQPRTTVPFHMNSRRLQYHFMWGEEDYGTISYEQQRTAVPFHMNSRGLRYNFIWTAEDCSTISYEEQRTVPIHINSSCCKQHNNSYPVASSHIPVMYDAPLPNTQQICLSDTQYARFNKQTDGRTVTTTLTATFTLPVCTVRLLYF
jgi:hypothetical protein